MRLLDTINAVQGVATKVVNKTTEELDSIKGAMESVVERVDTVAGEVTTMGAKMDSIDLMESVVVRSVESTPSVWEILVAIGTIAAAIFSFIAICKSTKTQKMHGLELELSRVEKEFDEVRINGNAVFNSVGMQYITELVGKCKEECNYSIYENKIRELKMTFDAAMQEFLMTLKIYKISLQVKVGKIQNEKTISIKEPYDILQDYLTHFQKLMHFLKNVQSQDDITEFEIQNVDENSPILRVVQGGDFTFENYCKSVGYNIYEIKKNIRGYLDFYAMSMKKQYDIFRESIDYIFSDELKKRNDAFEALKKVSGNKKKKSEVKKYLANYVLGIISMLSVVGCGKEDVGVDMMREVVMEVSEDWVELELRGVGERSGNRIEGDVWESMGEGGKLDRYAMVVIGERVEYVPLNGELQRVGFEMGSESVISVFGSVTELVCKNNGLVGIEVRENDILHRLDITENGGMSTEAYDRLYCSLPDRVGLRSGELLALSAWGEDDEHVNEVVESNGENARMRNWKVLEGWNEVETRGEKRCE